MTNPYESPTHCEAGEAKPLSWVAAIEYLLWVCVWAGGAIEVLAGIACTACVGNYADEAMRMLLVSTGGAAGALVAIMLLGFCLIYRIRQLGTAMRSLAENLREAIE